MALSDVNLENNMHSIFKKVPSSNYTVEQEQVQKKMAKEDWGITWEQVPSTTYCLR